MPAKGYIAGYIMVEKREEGWRGYGAIDRKVVCNELFPTKKKAVVKTVNDFLEALEWFQGEYIKEHSKPKKKKKRKKK